MDHLLLFGTAMPTDGTEVSEADTDLSGSDLARMGQSRAGRRGAKQHERFQARTKARKLRGQGHRQVGESAAFPGRGVLTAVGAGNWQSR